MTVIGIILVLLLLFLLIPVGVDAGYHQKLWLKLKIGWLRFAVFPRREKKQPSKPKQPKPKKEKTKVPKDQKKLHLNKDDIFTLLKIAVRTLHRFRKHLYIDRLKLYWTAAAEDPYDAVMQYGGLNAGLSALMPYVHEFLKIGEEDLRTAVDFARSSTEIDAELTATLQIWEILLVVNCAAFAALTWFLKKKKQERRAAKAAAQKGSA